MDSYILLEIELKSQEWAYRCDRGGEIQSRPEGYARPDVEVAQIDRIAGHGARRRAKAKPRSRSADVAIASLARGFIFWPIGTTYRGTRYRSTLGGMCQNTF